jgi:hypothetical protein
MLMERKAEVPSWVASWRSDFLVNAQDAFCFRFERVVPSEQFPKLCRLTPLARI